MANRIENSRSIYRGLPALVMTAALALSGCGGGGDDASSDTTNAGRTKSSDTSERHGSSEKDESGDKDFPKPVAVLPFEVDAPSGHRMIAAKCDPGGSRDPNKTEGADDDSTDDDATDDNSDDGVNELKYATWITYTVPEEWGVGGRGSAGSGGVTGTDEDRSFLLDPKNSSKGSVKIAVDWDSRTPDGKVTDYNGDPWKTFDYDSKIGDDEARITFDKVATVKAGDQEADLFYLDPAQAPEHVSRTEYRVRLTAFELPTGRKATGGYELVPYSFVVTVTFDEEKFPIDQETIEKIVGSVVIPECVWDITLLDYELMLNLDLNGDGHIRSAEDAQKEMKEKLDKMQKDLKEDLAKERSESSED